MEKLVQYLKESRQEARKVNWPSKKKTVRYTLVVIAISVAVAIFLGGLDLFFQTILKFII